MNIKIRGAIMAVKSPKQVSENFSVQEVFLDTSSYNQFTGDRYDNIALIQNNNSRVDLSQCRPGQMVEMKCRLNGRVFDKKDGTKGVFQNIVVMEFDYVKNTSGEIIVIEDYQLLKVDGL